MRPEIKCLDSPPLQTLQSLPRDVQRPSSSQPRPRLPFFAVGLSNVSVSPESVRWGIGLPDIERKKAACPMPPSRQSTYAWRLERAPADDWFVISHDDYREGKRRPAAASSSF
jgi:hypothetical protein